MAAGFKEGLKAYSQSAGYAEQALHGIKVVSANGQEKNELYIYNSFLNRVKE
jgi:hypothetical protein